MRRYHHLDDGQNEDKCHFYLLFGEIAGKALPNKTRDFGDGQCCYHKSASALAALRLFEQRVPVIWLPTYCSELNPIELFWRYLKDHACANKLQGNIEEGVKAAVKLMTTQNSQTSD